jgi:hypothetical protein
VARHVRGSALEPHDVAVDVGDLEAERVSENRGRKQSSSGR